MKIGQNYLKKKTFLHFLGARTLFAGSKCHDLVVADAAGTRSSVDITIKNFAFGMHMLINVDLNYSTMLQLHRYHILLV